VRCLDDETRVVTSGNNRQHAFVFAPPRCGPHQIGIQFPRYDGWGHPLTKALIVDVAYQPADRVLERGELLIVTADNMALLRFVEDSGMFQRVGRPATRIARVK
jgi:hypothetical protein